MALTINKQLTLLFKLVFVVMLILVGVFFASNSEYVYASSCGTDYHATYTCENGGHDWIGMNTIACPTTWYLAQKTLDRVYYYGNPPSHKYGGAAGTGDIACVPLPNNCPSYCY
jgi:hypothetical protein